MDPNAHSSPTSSHNHLTAPATSSLRPAVVATQSYITGNNSGNLNSFNTTSNMYYTDPDIEKLQSWLSSLKPWERHQDIQSSRLKGTGEWLLQMAKFKAWHDGTIDSAFCCYGGPGVGKTFIR